MLVCDGLLFCGRLPGTPVSPTIQPPPRPFPLSTRSSPPQVRVVQPTYPLTAGLSLPSLRSAITQALDKLQEVPFPPEWIDEQIILDNGWPDLREALVAAHNPQEEV